MVTLSIFLIFPDVDDADDGGIDDVDHRLLCLFVCLLTLFIRSFVRFTIWRADNDMMMLLLTKKETKNENENEWEEEQTKNKNERDDDDDEHEREDDYEHEDGSWMLLLMVVVANLNTEKRSNHWTEKHVFIILDVVLFVCLFVCGESWVAI